MSDTLSTPKMNEPFREANAFCDTMPVVVKKPTPIAELIRNCGRSYRDIEIESGGRVKFNTLSELLSSSRPNPQLETMLALAKGTGIPFLTIAAAFAGTRDERPALRSAFLNTVLAEYETLTESQREKFAGTIEMLAEGIHAAKTKPPTR